MNPLTLVKRIQNLNSKEAALGISEAASWHAKYKESAYVFVGGIPFDLTEGDLLAVFAQYGEIVDVNLVRDKGTGKSKGFAFIAYEDQRSTNLAVDNLNGAQILGRVVRVDHVTKYKKKEEDDEETERQKREARGICRAFQRGECTRGAGCKFSHDEQRAANTGWGHEDNRSRWGHDKFEHPEKQDNLSGNDRSLVNHPTQGGRREERRSRGQKDNEIERKSGVYNMREQRKLRSSEDNTLELKLREDGYDRNNQRLRKYGDDKFEPKSVQNDYKMDQRLKRHEGDEFERRDDHRREEKRSKRHESKSYLEEDQEKKRRDRWSGHDRVSSSHRHREREDRMHKSER
ncbi:hypothetical protein K2173_012299 [Erythroxylum novogranatense]|uniref:Uncharacterized protein n=1 Tax=Erythroxylum novogranatense TaxID=1862640 RepID=A0AAV8SCI3_9ROSI|nr:hypothetical protein K2173_012299 [Erythroxylum novogranatense]